MSLPLLATLLPIRDARDRLVAHLLATCPARERPGATEWSDDEAVASLELVAPLARLTGRTLYVPVPASLVRGGALARFSSADVTWLIATSTLDDAATRRVVERLLTGGTRFALDGFPDGSPLPNGLRGAAILLDAPRVSPSALVARVQLLTEAGLRPLARGVDDRATRRRVLDAGAQFTMGRPLVRSAQHRVDGEMEHSIVRSLRILAEFADGRPPDARFDAYVRDDPLLSSTVMRTATSAAIGARGTRSVSQALTLLGRDAVLDRLAAVTAWLIGEVVQDPELAFLALRRARCCERVGAAFDAAGHPRARVLAGLLSTLEWALGHPGPVLATRLALPAPYGDVLEERRRPLGALVNLVEALEGGWWADLRSRCVDAGIAPQVVSDAHADAWRSARDELNALRTEFA